MIKTVKLPSDQKYICNFEDVDVLAMLCEEHSCDRDAVKERLPTHEELEYYMKELKRLSSAGGAVPVCLPLV